MIRADGTALQLERARPLRWFDAAGRRGLPQRLLQRQHSGDQVARVEGLRVVLVQQALQGACIGVRGVGDGTTTALSVTIARRCSAVPSK